MNVKDLAPIVLALLLVGMVAGVGVLILDKFSNATKIDSVILNENTTSVVSSGAVNAVNDELLSLDNCRDATNETQLVSGETCNLTNAVLGTVRVDGRDGALLSLNYTYSRDSASSTSIDSSRNAVADISEDWLALVVTLVILSLILGLVISSFAFKR